MYGGTASDLVAGDMWLVRSHVACAFNVGWNWWTRCEDQFRSRDSRRGPGARIFWFPDLWYIALDAIAIIASLI